MFARLAYWLRRAADRIDYEGAPKLMGRSFTFEIGEGIRFRDDGKGCPLAYLSERDYQRAHDEADVTWERWKARRDQTLRSLLEPPEGVVQFRCRVVESRMIEDRDPDRFAHLRLLPYRFE
ncbi:hypothetical protein ABZ897_00760 [Nonomuraea sp. NPDC046802]|uniref:hypothetical protein n=1 Tax=Nonomuraea sp. NPDC046802 TaxID=3154919 RepID=UPI0033C742D7